MFSSQLPIESNGSTNLVTPKPPKDWLPFICTEANMKMVWEKLNEFPILFDDMERGNYPLFVQGLVSPNTIILSSGDYGIVRACNIVPWRNADIHLAFWDRRFRGRDGLCKEALKWLFFEFGLNRVTIVVPSVVHYTINFILALGFRREGVIRQSWAYNGKLLDRHIFGLLRDELFKKEE